MLQSHRLCFVDRQFFKNNNTVLLNPLSNAFPTMPPKAVHAVQMYMYWVSLGRGHKQREACVPINNAFQAATARNDMMN